MLDTRLILWTFVAAVAAATGLRLWLAARQIRHVRRHRDRVPEAFSGRIRLEDHRRAADYTVDRTRAGMAAMVWHMLILLGWTAGGGLDHLLRFWSTTLPGPVAAGTAALLSLMFINALLDLPFAIHRTFVIEARFGFNRTTPATFVTDLLKQALLGMIIGAPLLALFLWLMEGGGAWWLWAWGAWLGFALLMTWLYPTLIAPLFNTFRPLPDPELARRVERLLERTGFHSKGVFVMDGSRRSAHGNAYFTGLGRSKRIVFFDTLLGALAPEEIEAVLAHELGHFRRRHVHKHLAVSALSGLTGLWLLDQLLHAPAVFQALGLSEVSAAGALALFMLLAPVALTFVRPLASWLSRRHEFEADEFAAALTGPAPLVRALVKLYRDNATTLTPDPLYSAWHDSHPPAGIRIEHLQARQA